MLPDDYADLVALGLKYVPEFISKTEEAALLSVVISPGYTTTYSQPGRHRIQRYGSNKPYNNYIVSRVIPEHFAVICRRLVTENFLATLPDSVTVNEYLSGDLIQAHVDSPAAGPVITVLSLGSSATMVLKHQEQRYTVSLPARSLIQLTGPIRYDWTHEILPVSAKRYSVVFRDSAA